MNECDKHSWFDEDDAKCPYCYPPKKRGVSKNEKLIKQLQDKNKFLRCALEDLVVYSKVIAKRAGVRMSDPNTGALDHAESILKELI